MNIKKYEIYNYWKDKAITKNFEVMLWDACLAEDEAVKIIDFSDEITCWACGILPYETADYDDIKALWNHDHLLDRAHILARSKGGEDIPSNLFLLCPNCHAEAPDTINLKNFYAWIYHKRKFESWVQIYEKEKAALIRRIDMTEIYTRCTSLNMNFDMMKTMRKQMRERCALHGVAVAMSSKMLSYIDILLEITNEKPQ